MWMFALALSPSSRVPNAVGKSNLVDAIQFLSRLASANLSADLLDAALSVRTDGNLSGNILDLFHRHQGHSLARILLAVEMIIPAEGIDGLGKKRKHRLPPSATAWRLHLIKRKRTKACLDCVFFQKIFSPLPKEMHTGTSSFRAMAQNGATR